MFDGLSLYLTRTVSRCCLFSVTPRDRNFSACKLTAPARKYQLFRARVASAVRKVRFDSSRPKIAPFPQTCTKHSTQSTRWQLLNCFDLRLEYTHFSSSSSKSATFRRTCSKCSTQSHFGNFYLKLRLQCTKYTLAAPARKTQLFGARVVSAVRKVHLAGSSLNISTCGLHVQYTKHTVATSSVLSAGFNSLFCLAVKGVRAQWSACLLVSPRLRIHGPNLGWGLKKTAPRKPHLNPCLARQTCKVTFIRGKAWKSVLILCSDLFVSRFSRDRHPRGKPFTKTPRQLPTYTCAHSWFTSNPDPSGINAFPHRNIDGLAT